MKKQQLLLKHGDRFAAFDPGGKLTGAGAFEVDAFSQDPINRYKIRETKEIPYKDVRGLHTFLYNHWPKYIIIEAWRLRKGKEKDFINDDFKPIQIIGMIKAFAFILGRDVNQSIFELPAHVKGRLKNPLPIPKRDQELINMQSEHIKDVVRLGRYWYLIHSGLK